MEHTCGFALTSQHQAKATLSEDSVLPKKVFSDGLPGGEGGRGREGEEEKERQGKGERARVSYLVITITNNYYIQTFWFAANLTRGCNG